MLNLFKYFDQKKSDSFCPKMFHYQNMTQVAKYVPKGQNVSVPPIGILLTIYACLNNFRKNFFQGSVTVL